MEKNHGSGQCTPRINKPKYEATKSYMEKSKIGGTIKVSQQRLEIRKTGRGTSNDNVSEFSQKIISLIPQQIQSLSNEFYSDANYEGEGTVFVKMR